MNKDFILDLVRSHLNSKNELTYHEFENIFGSWKRQEQYDICGILESSGIFLVDQKSIESKDDNNVTEINAKNKKEIIIKKTDLEYPTNNTTDKLQDIKLDIH